MADHWKYGHDCATIKRSHQDAQTNRQDHTPLRSLFKLLFWSQDLHNSKTKKNCSLQPKNTYLIIASHINFSTDHRWFDKCTTIGIGPRAHVMCKKLCTQIRRIICPERYYTRTISSGDCPYYCGTRYFGI